MIFKKISYFFTFVLSSLLLTDVNSMEDKLNNTLYYIPNENIKDTSSRAFISIKENGICSAKECIGDEVRKKAIKISKLSKEFNNIFKYSCSVGSIRLTGDCVFITNLILHKNTKSFAICNFTTVNPTVIMSILNMYTNKDYSLSFQNIYEVIFDNDYISFGNINNLGKNNFNISYNKITIGGNTYNYKKDGIITVHPGTNNITTKKNTQQNTVHPGKNNITMEKNTNHIQLNILNS